MKSKIVEINGPVIKVDSASELRVRDMVQVGEKKLIGEIISVDREIATIQIFEETSGLKVGEEVATMNMPLSSTLGPGIIGNFFDGIQRPLEKIYSLTGSFISDGIGLISLDMEKLWDVKFIKKVGDYINSGESFAEVRETSQVVSKILVPPGISGKVVEIKPDGKYNLEQEVIKLQNEDGNIKSLKLYHKWPVRTPRPYKKRLEISRPLITGQRVLDIFFPIAKGGSVAIPGGFGTGKTMLQHQLAKWSDADIIVYIGCGERGNEMTEVLEDFPKLIDPRTNKPLMERTVLIANTSNMPVAAREASIYTGVTIAEYYRDMGYNVAIMADSTSRWAEALREISGRLEEMPAEEGFPAYLPSRIAQFYERAGYVDTLGNGEASVTVIGAVSPPGGDFSEPVTENTKRYVSTFLILEKALAYIRHYPAVNFLTSYSAYPEVLKDFYDENVSTEVSSLRYNMMNLLTEDNKLSQIASLVGEDVLATGQRLVIEVARLVKKGFLQQNATHEIDKYVPLKKQFLMLKVIEHIYERGLDAVKKNITMTEIKDEVIFSKILQMKYDIPNENYEENFNNLNREIDDYYDKILKLNETEDLGDEDE